MTWLRRTMQARPGPAAAAARAAALPVTPRDGRGLPVEDAEPGPARRAQPSRSSRLTAARGSGRWPRPGTGSTRPTRGGRRHKETVANSGKKDDFFDAWSCWRRNRRPLRCVPALMLLHHPNRPSPNLRRKALARRLPGFHRSILSRVGASSKPGAVQHGKDGLTLRIQPQKEDAHCPND